MTAPHTQPSPSPPDEALDALKGYARIGLAEDNAVLRQHLASAIAMCEAFTGSALLARAHICPLARHNGAQYLPHRPVVAIENITERIGSGQALALPGYHYRLHIDDQGRGEVVLLPPVSEPVDQPVAVDNAPIVEAHYVAGSYADWSAIPAPLSDGIIMLAAHLYRSDARGQADASLPPAGVAALWRPWRRLRLGAL